MAYPRRPLPPPPGRPLGSRPNPNHPADLYSVTDPYFMSYAYPAHNVQPAEITSEPPSSVPVGTLLHKGFYDLLSMIPTPSPSRFLGWGGNNSPSPFVSPLSQNEVDTTVAGPPYETLRFSPAKAAPPAQHAKKGRRISKDMVSKPTGFVHLVHASDADQLEALLTRWGPDGLGKLGDPRWANPIKNFVRQKVQANAVNQVVNAFRTDKSDLDGERVYGQLHVVNGTSAPNSSILTTAAQENVSLSNSAPEGLPGRPGNSTIRWGGGLQTHIEEVQESEDGPTPLAPPTPQKRIIVPSLATLDKAVSARIFFENLYFPLLRHPPSREQRRLAMEQDMLNMQLAEAQKDNLRARWRQNETDYLRERRRKVDASAFIKLKTIGHGAFGVVSLVREKSTACVFAMKQLRKVDMLRKGQEGHVRAERDVLKSASMIASPTGAEWIVRLHYSFQDRDHLYLILEYMGGGDLLNLLIERDVFEEDFTRFYIAEMILAVESCHKLGFIHRDIKPDNFLFDPQGHIRLSDFGLATDLHWAHDTSYYEQQRLHLLRRHGIDLEDSNGIADGRKTKRMSRRDVEALMGGGDGQEGIFTWREKNRRKLAYSVCGTNSYMSPEVIRGQGYTFSCDWWSLGVIMYECLYGFPPFVSNSRHVTRQKILNWRNSLKFPSRPQVSPEGIHLMQQLLCEPEDRLGSQAISSFSRPNSVIAHARRASFFPIQSNNTTDGADLIKAHPWFRGIDWQNIHRYPAPFKPELRNPEDTRHFDDDIPPEPLAPANGAPADATKDPMLLDKTHGVHILNSRKALAFAGFTHKSPRAIGYLRADKAFDLTSNTYGQDVDRGRTLTREAREVGKGRAISM